MELIIIFVMLIIILLIGSFIFGINIKQLKTIAENRKLDDITNRFPENIQICKDILKKVNNENVKIKENEDKTASLYMTASNTIFIANIKNSYTRIQTIAHECLHSVQNKKLLMFNFIYSNIYLIYFILSVILTIIGIFKNYNLQITILIILGFLYYVVRSYLEIDAMTKAKYLAGEYIEEQAKQYKTCTMEESKQIIKQYEKINNVGIPTTIYILFTNCIIKVIIYTLLSFILQLIK